MFFSKDLLSSLLPHSLRSIKDSDLLLRLSQSIPDAICGGDSDDQECRDDAAALQLKLVAIAAILISSLAGIALPLVGKHRRFLPTDGSLFAAAKAFAAGVILATGFVHMLPDGASNLTDPCLPEHPWSDFPFSGALAMAATLLTLVVDFVGTQVYEGRGRVGPGLGEGGDGYAPVPVEEGEGYFGHIHSHGNGEDNDEVASRQVVVSQVLEVGIVSHSILIGLSLGVSHSPCTIRPLIFALSFHQFFEGFALGGCISQAQFKTLSTIIMSSFFTLTTPSGIAIGIAIASSYNADSARALIVEGILDCLSAGILIYMSLVDLIAVDFTSKRMRSNVRLQIVSYFALFSGVGLMSLLAIWA